VQRKLKNFNNSLFDNVLLREEGEWDGLRDGLGIYLVYQSFEIF